MLFFPQGPLVRSLILILYTSCRACLIELSCIVAWGMAIDRLTCGSSSLSFCFFGFRIGRMDLESCFRCAALICQPLNVPTYLPTCPLTYLRHCPSLPSLTTPNDNGRLRLRLRRRLRRERTQRFCDDDGACGPKPRGSERTHGGPEG